MKITKRGSEFEFIIEGPVGEGSPLFNQNISDATKIVIDMEKMTYINSIGVKNWILWTVRIPKSARFVLRKCPLVMINQAATVVGFMPANGVIESFNAPYACPDCNTEKMVLLSEGKDYVYGDETRNKSYTLPKATCPKCSTEMEPDFVEAKVFTFLDRK